MSIPPRPEGEGPEEPGRSGSEPTWQPPTGRPYGSGDFGQPPPAQPPYGQPPYGPGDATPPPYGQPPPDQLPPPYGQQPYGYGYPTAPPRNGLGLAALITGIAAVVCSLAGFLVLTLFLGVGLGIAALVTGIAGRRRARRGEATNGGAALAGMVLGPVAIVVAILWIILFVAFFARAGDCINLPEDQIDQCLNDKLLGS